MKYPNRHPNNMMSIFFIWKRFPIFVSANPITSNIPKEIIVDLDNLDIGASIKISSVNLPENVKPTIKDRDFVIATVAAPTVVKEPEKPAEASEESAENQEASSEGADGAPDDKSKAETDADKNKDGAKKDDQKASTEKK